MARAVKQNLPQPPPTYDQEYVAQLANAINRYMVQREAPGESIAARFISTDMPIVDKTPPTGVTAYPDTSQLPNGTLYLTAVPGGTAGQYFVSVVKKTDV